ncbi:SIR2 family protein [Candidatus Haliotispira prima]|uniref:SIR2 family protein n=1 Tax=Candidatus Haliotispira prima TaxID=3034016 RepID=A0ABY8MJF7_9SPIO|nr:SIR2 family protein [Candidatus Haliotispira prima]
MKNATIEELAYILEQAHKNKEPKPIFFLGAGASVSGGIPLANDIIKDILKKHSKAPRVKKLSDTDKKSYAKVMEALLASQRKKLLKGYIDGAKVNVTHLYLAQLMHDGFVDYVLTVNFDNLMLRALSLLNQFPPTYDMAILKDLTTTTFEEKSVVYLHGQHHGLWLLNTPDEMKKVGETVPRIFDSIKNGRPWVFIGYSGNDPIFEHIKGLGSFDDDLFWVTYNDHAPNEKVREFLDKPNTNARLIEGHDADSFILTLHTKLGALDAKLGVPQIMDQPFSFTEGMLDNIVDIDNKEHFKDIKKRLEISKEQIHEAREQFEEGIAPTAEASTKLQIDVLKKEILVLMIIEEYDENIINKLSKEAKNHEDSELNDLFASLYLGWGTNLGKLAKTKTGKAAENLYEEAFAKFQQAIDIKPDCHEAFNNWGNALGKLAGTKTGKDRESLYAEAFVKYQRAVEIKSDYHRAFNNWGNTLGYLAGTKREKAAENLYKEAFVKYQRAIEIKPDYDEAFTNWGNDLGYLAGIRRGKVAENLYKEAFEKYQRAVEIKPDKHETFNNWATVLGKLAETKRGKDAESLYGEAFEKYQRAIEIKPDYDEAFTNWGANLGNLAGTKTGKAAESLYEEAFVKYERAIEIKPDKHEAFTNWGTALGKLAGTKTGKAAESLYEQAFVKYERAVEIKPEYYEAFINWGTALGKLAGTKTGKAAESLYEQAFVKYERVIEIKPDKHKAFNNWGTYLGKLAGTKTGQDAEILYEEAFVKYQKAIEIKPDYERAFTNWGNALGELAGTKTGKAAESLYEEAFVKYQRAIEIKPDDGTAFTNWGANLIYLAKTKTGKEAESLYKKAFATFRQAVELGGKYYNLSCLYAVTGDKENALHYLELSLEQKKMTVDFVEKDEDWSKYLQDKDWKDLLEKYR